MTTAPVVLCLNAGSSSLKFSVYEADDRSLAEGAVEEIGRDGTRAWIKRSGGASEKLSGRFADHGAAVSGVFDLLGRHGLPEPAGVVPAGEDGNLRQRRAPGVTRSALDAAARQANHHWAR